MPDPSADTVAYYDRRAAEFSAQTAGLDMSALHDRFLRHVPPGGRILDAGCGVGRDALAFVERGFAVVAFDASVEMVRLARERVAGRAEVQHMRFEDVAWLEEFDGIWACASLLHAPIAQFRGIAGRFITALRLGGLWYMSFKFGVGEQVVGGRNFTDHTEETLRIALRGTGVRLSEAWITNDVRTERASERWLNAVAVRR
jgi:SAM-dependent methyltransferase